MVEDITDSLKIIRDKLTSREKKNKHTVTHTFVDYLDEQGRYPDRNLKVGSEWTTYSEHSNEEYPYTWWDKECTIANFGGILELAYANKNMDDKGKKFLNQNPPMLYMFDHDEEGVISIYVLDTQYLYTDIGKENIEDIVKKQLKVITDPEEIEELKDVIKPKDDEKSTKVQHIWIKGSSKTDRKDNAKIKKVRFATTTAGKPVPNRG